MRAADRLAGEERDGPERGVADAEGGLARALRRVAQRVILERLARDPLVVLPALANDSLLSRFMRLVRPLIRVSS